MTDLELDGETERYRALITSEYQQLNHRLGWRLLTSAKANIAKAPVALITINPGGRTFVEPILSVEGGSAYVVETWPARQQRLQWQVKRMFEAMNAKPEEALSGYLVPFRSPTWTDLPEKAASLRCGLEIWRSIFGLACATTVIVFGKDMAPPMTRLLAATDMATYPADWGNITIDVYRFGIVGKLVVLPHLSRFALFGRSASEASFRAALAA